MQLQTTTVVWLSTIDGALVAGTDALTSEQLRRFFEVCPELLALLDHQGLIVASNDAWTTLLGYPAATLRGRDLRELTHPDDRAALVAALDRLQRPPTTVAVEVRLRPAKGRDVVLQAVLHSVMGEGGDDLAIYLTAHDVSDQRRAEAALTTTSEQLRLAMEAAPIGMVLADLDGRAQVVNEAMCRLLDRSRDEVLGLRLDEAADPRDREAAQTHLAAMLSDDRQAHQFELRFVGGDRVVHSEVTGCVVHDVDGQPVYLLGQIVDVTHRHATEARLQTSVDALEASNDRLEQANEMLDHFAASASHDLRGPLSTVQTILETVLLRPATPLHRRDEDLLQRARRHTSRLLDTTQALLTLSRHQDNRHRLQPVDLATLVAEVLDAMEPDLLRSQAHVEVDELPTVPGDAPMLRVLIQNLLGNAVKFAHPERSPQVRVTTQPAKGFWELAVTDNGIGLATGQAERIFERFVRGGDADAPEGAGLGLATCRQIAEFHGGDIHAEPLTVGVRFVVRLPAADHDDQ